jgi:hypothetical protein
VIWQHGPKPARQQFANFLVVGQSSVNPFFGQSWSIACLPERVDISPFCQIFGRHWLIYDFLSIHVDMLTIKLIMLTSAENFDSWSIGA